MRLPWQLGNHKAEFGNAPYQCKLPDAFDGDTSDPIGEAVCNPFSRVITKALALNSSALDVEGSTFIMRPSTCLIVWKTRQTDFTWK
jgi:hypothetical protein